MDTEVDDAEAVYLTCPLQVDPHVEAGRNKSADPLSASMTNTLGGVPILISPVQTTPVSGRLKEMY